MVNIFFTKTPINSEGKLNSANGTEITDINMGGELILAPLLHTMPKK